MSLPRTVQAVVFDMDGLLVDTEVVYRDAMGLVMAELGHEMSMDVFRAMIGLPSVHHILTGHYGADFPVARFNARIVEVAMSVASLARDVQKKVGSGYTAPSVLVGVRAKP